ncbi:MAG TPA: hypothetical protein VFV64_09435 [Permianibacter sp.]|nr:hypothetical protein [Permianibacter sp.]
MKQVWLLFRHYLFWQPIMRPVFGLGVLLALTGVVWFIYSGSDPGQKLLLLLGSVLMCFFPVMTGGAGFLQAASNPRTALLPHFRVKAGLALLLLVIAASGTFATAAAFAFQDWQWRVFAACFVIASLFIQTSQWLLSRRWGAMVFWLLPVTFSQLWHLPTVRSFWQDSLALSVACFAVTVGWCALILWLQRARSIRRFTVGFVQQGAFPGNNEVHVHAKVLTLGFSGSRSATNTMLWGMYYNLKNRLGLQVLMLAIMPLIIGVVLLIPALIKGKALTEIGVNPIVLLAMGLYGSLIGGFISRESVARVRFLWLRCPGDRSTLWQQLDRMLRGEWWVSVVASATYAGVIWLLTDMPTHYGIWFVLLYGSSLFCLQYLSQYLRVRLTSGVFTGLAYCSLLLVAGALIITTLATEALWPIASLCAGFVLLGGVLRRGSQQSFHRVDWCQIKPMTLSRMSALTQPTR